MAKDESYMAVKAFPIFKLIKIEQKVIVFRLVDENMSNLDVDWVRGVLRNALCVWSKETPLNFREVNDKRVDIEVGFSR